MFILDPITGKIYWKEDQNQRVKSGNEAGSARTGGYRTVMINNSSYRVHRIIWAMFYGKYPDDVIDHINGDKTDNRVVNLRDISFKHNCQNKVRPNITNKSGVLGIYKAGSKYRASISLNNKNKILGTFHTKEEAHDAYITAKRVMHPGCTI